MLVLKRMVNEVLCVGEDVEIVVVDIGKGKVKLGITAPPHVRIDRKEIRESKDANAASIRK